MASWSAARRVAAALPAVEETTSYGTPAFKVKGKLFLRLLEDDARIAVFTDEREALVSADPDAFTVPDHYLEYPMVVVVLAAIDDAQLAEVVTDSWRFRAPAKLRSA